MRGGRLFAGLVGLVELACSKLVCRWGGVGRRGSLEGRAVVVERDWAALVRFGRPGVVTLLHLAFVDEAVDLDTGLVVAAVDGAVAEQPVVAASSVLTAASSAVAIDQVVPVSSSSFVVAGIEMPASDVLVAAGIHSWVWASSAKEAGVVHHIDSASAADSSPIRSQTPSAAEEEVLRSATVPATFLPAHAATAV